ncbi:restriction endonuclease subunit S [Streptomyces coeruleoprunus]|uniref:Restriction endonuclease subunit S n=1 Tax=Streptomyces coeruleoprunus TaxID=285563 RepID=A0ABV9XCE8_9ACTN
MWAEDEIRWVPVGEVGEVRMGKQLSPASRSASGQMPYLRVANVFDGFISYHDVNYMGFSAAEKEVYGLRKGDILLNEGQENLMMVGRSAIFDGEPGVYCFQNTLIRFRPGPAILPEYAQAVFVAWRRSGIFASVAEKTSISHLGGGRFARLLFPLLPLQHQRRIIEVLAAVEESDRAVEASLEKLRPVRNAFLNELASFDRMQLRDVISSGPQNGLYKPAESYGDTGVPIVRISSFSGGPSDLTRGLLCVSASRAEEERYGLSVGDLLVNRVNTPELVGKSTVVGRLHEPTLFESNIMRCRLLLGEVDPRFVEAWMSTRTVKSYFASRTKPAVSQASINGPDVLGCPFPKLDLSEQQGFLSRLDAIDGRMTAETAELLKLRQLKRGVLDDLLGGKLQASAGA